MAKAATLFALFALLSIVLSAARMHAARPSPVDKISSPEGGDGDMVEELSCDGVGEEECLMRRTLTAHTDYIYTQEKPHA